MSVVIGKLSPSSGSNPTMTVVYQLKLVNRHQEVQR